MNDDLRIAIIDLLEVPRNQHSLLSIDESKTFFVSVLPYLSATVIVSTCPLVLYDDVKGT